MVHLVVIAKEPAPGVSKTRLCPPCSPAQAATVAHAAIADTLATVSATRALSRTLVLDGRPGDWLPSDLDLIPQRGHGLADRLTAAFEDSPLPALLIGMDTPQVTTSLLETGAARLMKPDVDAVIGPTIDGGYWAIGFKERCGDAFLGVPMSTDRTADVQCRRLEELGLNYEVLPRLTDIDYWEDAVAVARSLPGSSLVRAVERIEQDLNEDSA